MSGTERWRGGIVGHSCRAKFTELVKGDEASTRVSPDQARTMADRIPQAQLSVIVEAGTWPQRSNHWPPVV